jgi:hypothetical protein
MTQAFGASHQNTHASNHHNVCVTSTYVSVLLSQRSLPGGADGALSANVARQNCPNCIVSL